MKVKNKINSYPMEQLAPIICGFLNKGKKVIVPARGNSMRPLVRNAKDSVILTAYKGQPVGVGDAVFYRRNNGTYVLHRIVNVDKYGKLILMGDNQCIEEKGIHTEDIVAIPVAFIRGEKPIYCDSLGYKRYAKFWAKTRFLRRVYRKYFQIRTKIASKIIRF